MADSNKDELLYIETEHVAVTIKGPAHHPSVSGVQVGDKESQLRIACDKSYNLTLKYDYDTVSTLTTDYASFGDYSVQPLFYEQQRYELIIESLSDHKVEFWHDNNNIRNSITSVGRNSKILSGIINFGNEIGLSDLIILVDGKKYMRITIEVFPSKISYKEDYKAIMSDITAEVYNLVFDFLKKTYDSFDTDSKKKSSPVEFFAIIKRIYDEFITAADMVLVKPHHVLETEHVVVPSHKIKRTDNKTIKWIASHPEYAQKAGDKILVSKALSVKKYITYDTNENRLTKYILMNTARRLERFLTLYGLLNRDNDAVVVEQIKTMIRGIQARYNAGFFKEVQSVPANSGMSLVFSMAPGYRELYRCYILLQHGLSVTGSIFNVSEKDMAELYEYWCFIKLNSILKEKYELQAQDVIKTNGKGLFVSLIKGQNSKIKYKNPATGEIIILSYNPKETNLPTVTQKPDNVLQLKKKGASFDYEYVFDAKYRINSALEGSDYNLSYENPGPQVDDINTMHRYRDAIVYKNGASPFERIMFGAYVLFPYGDEEKYKEHHFYKSINKVNIGGLPFLPTATSLVEKMLSELVDDTPEQAAKRTVYPRGTDYHVEVKGKGGSFLIENNT